MSRIAKKPIAIPSGITIKVDGSVITVTGPKGTLTRTFLPTIAITAESNELVLVPQNDTPATRALWGTYASHLKNMIAGVTTPFSKKLILEGVGYKSEVSGKNLVLALGFSHPVSMPIPEGLTVTAEKNQITVSGIDTESVGQFTATVRSLKKPEPYKGKGFRYDGEVIRRKQGKKAA